MAAYTYIAPPTGVAFHNARVGTYGFKGLRGVPGSGKSVVCCWDMRYKAEMQPAVEDPETGEMVRWTRWAVVRKTNVELAGTTIKTWLSWFPVYLTDMHNSYPIKGTFRAPSLRQDGTVVRMDLEFYPSDADNFMNALDSLEISGAWVNEAAQIEWEKIFKLQERCGRFKPPGAAASGAVGFMDFGVIMDTNTPLETSWWHEKEQVTLPTDMLWFVQPPAMIEVPDANGGGKVLVRNDAENNARFARYVDNGICAEAVASSRVYAAMGPAENVEHHNGGWNYYEKLVPGSTDEYKRVRLLNQYGRSKGGLAVYKESWNDRFHCTTDRMDPMRGLTVFVGMDTGRHPAAVVAQVTPMGQVRVYRDLYCPNMGVPTFVEDHLVPLLTNEFGWPRTNVVVFVDPASNNLSEMSELSPLRYLNEKAGLHAFVPEILVGRNNDVITRIGAVEELLRGNRAGSPDLLVSAQCRWLRDGFNGDYKFAKTRGAPGSADKYRDVPDKDEWSHVADAMQYLACGIRNGAGIEIASRARANNLRGDVRMSAHVSCGCV